MRLALVHDCISNKGGAERVLLNMHKAFPEAPIFTSIYDKNNTYPEFENCDIKTTWLQKITSSEKFYKKTFIIFGLRAMQSHNLSDYDIVLISSTHSAKYVKTNKNNLVINYCYTPFRLAWDPKSYSFYENTNGFGKLLLDEILKKLRDIDYYYAQRANKYIAMTDKTAARIRKYYGVKSAIKIINPSIDTSKYYMSENNDDYFLVVSRLEKYKKIDLVIEAFNKLGYKLKIVGRGMGEDKLRKQANNNIEFLGGVSQKVLNDLYSKCKALIFPQHEDYGLTPLEANASGRPVIAYGHGGIETTMLPYDNHKQENLFTAVFFSEQNSDSLINAIKTFEKLDFDSSFIRKNAERFDDKYFIGELKEFVKKEFKKFNFNN